MFKLDKIDLPQLGYRGLEADLSEEEQAIQVVAHRFAEEVMRPIGEKLDKMTPEEVIAEGSPLHDYMRQIHESGILDLGALAEMRADVAAGGDIASVIKRHRVFFREEAATAAALRRWTPEALAEAQRQVRRVERALVASGTAGAVLADQAMIRLAERARRLGRG